MAIRFVLPLDFSSNLNELLVMKRKIRFILNPHSGLGRHRRVESAVEKHLDRTMFDYEIVHTQHAQHATAIAAEAVEMGFHVVAVAGGDGSVNEVAKALYRTDTIMAVIPTGSGNGLARHLHIPLRVSKAVQLINHFEVSEIDVGFVDKHLFVSVAGMGFDAEIAEKYSHANIRGFMTYFGMIAGAFPAYKPKKYRLRFQDKELNEKAFIISFSNSNQYGYNTSFAPDASLTDGLLDISVIKKPPLLKTPLLAHLLYFQRIDETPYVQVYRTDQVEVKKKKRVLLNIDGEPVEINKKKLFIRTEKQALKIIIPK